MTIRFLSLGLVSLFCSAIPHVLASDDPALHLKAFFVESYVNRGVQRGANPDRAKGEAECIFAAMADNLTLGQYISLSATSAAGVSPQSFISDSLRQKMQACVQK